MLNNSSLGWFTNISNSSVIECPSNRLGLAIELDTSMWRRACICL
ncbi:hypothetical protein CsSME_00031654 [Camellia sinensis var. sinensis]